MPKGSQANFARKGHQGTPLGTRRCIDIVDTNHYLGRMKKARATSRDKDDQSALLVADRPVSLDSKGSINLRIEANTRQLIDHAAAVMGKTRTEFMVESARRVAIDVLLDQRLFVLNADKYDAFMQALDKPTAPGSKLRSLLRRVPAWQN